jgi:trigger factor
VLQQNNQLPAMFADVRRGLTIAAVVHGATVKDTDGNEVDTDEFFGPAASAADAEEGATDVDVEEVDIVDVAEVDVEGADDDDK